VAVRTVADGLWSGGSHQMEWPMSSRAPGPEVGGWKCLAGSWRTCWYSKNGIVDKLNTEHTEKNKARCVRERRYNYRKR
jgi:hypothetical protein